MILDYRRLGKQRVEAKQLIDILDGKESRWKHHPALKMWVGYTDALKCYCNCMIVEWKKRGYKNTMELYEIPPRMEMPEWWGDESFHSAHRAALLFKNNEYYSQFGWSETPELNYIWPEGKIT